MRLFDVTRASFERAAALYPGQLGADLKAIVQNPNDPAVVGALSELPSWNAQLRTTCVATMLAGGHAENALPQTASAVVNCRLLPVDNAGRNREDADAGGCRPEGERLGDDARQAGRLQADES